MTRFEYTVSIVEPFGSMKEELTYLMTWGEEGWELVSKETVAVKKRVAIVAAGAQDGVNVYNKFYWKRVHDGRPNGENSPEGTATS